MEEKRTYQIPVVIALVVVLLLLGINWGTQPFHTLQKDSVAPTRVSIIRFNADGAEAVDLEGRTAQELQACARRAVLVWVGPAKDHDLEEGEALYHVTVAGNVGGEFTELCNVTADQEGFVQTSRFRYRVVGASWWKSVEQAFQTVSKSQAEMLPYEA